MRASFAQCVLATTAVLLLLGPVEIFCTTCPYPTGSTGLCISNAAQQLNQLSTSNPTVYCEQAAVISANASNCIEACNTVDVGDVLEVAEQKVYQFCQAASPTCASFIAYYYIQTTCFTQYGGALAVASSISQQFIAKKPTTSCKQLTWGLNCLLAYNSCPYNADLGYQLIAATPQLVTAMAICGYPNTTNYLPIITNNNQCNANTNPTIEAQCIVAPSVATAVTNAEMCQALSTQFSCILSNSVGCTTAQARYLLPRLDSYALANLYLGCTLQLFGLPILPAPQSRCNYVSQVNACFFQNVVSTSFSITRMAELLNEEMPIGGFCKTVQAQASGMTNCTTSLYECPLPHAALFHAPTVYDNTYAPSMGVLPMNAWGMQTLYTLVSSGSACSAVPLWSSGIYVPPQTSTVAVQGVIGNRATAPRGQTSPLPSRGTTPKSG
jgi:hypothetical protein